MATFCPEGLWRAELKITQSVNTKWFFIPDNAQKHIPNNAICTFSNNIQNLILVAYVEADLPRSMSLGHASTKFADVLKLLRLSKQQVFTKYSKGEQTSLCGFLVSYCNDKIATGIRCPKIILKCGETLSQTTKEAKVYQKPFDQLESL
jgi:hypothetical protein